jgi:hypothetical protein
MATNQIELASTNFDDIETSLIAWLKTYPEWADYDFTVPGSASALLIDILSGMTYKQNVQSNFAMNERFLTTARLRSNVLRRAKELNYTTHSAVSATATLHLKFEPDDNPDFVVIPNGTRFQAVNNNKTYVFSTTSTYTAMKEDGYEVDIEIVEGDPLSYEWTVAQNQTYFVIPNPNIDISRMKVNVKYTSDDVYWTEYVRNYNIVENSAESTIYYIEEIDKQYFRIYFGDDHISKAIKPGNIVQVNYIVTAGTAANNIAFFQLVDELDYDPEITTVNPANGGQDIEEIGSIKRYAPLAFYSQNRAVIASDYEYMIKNQFPQISSVNAWGGEENTPPQYGRVCVSAMTGGNYVLTDSLKDEISRIFNDNKIVGSKRISWFDPVIIQLVPTIKIFYNPAFTAETPMTLRTSVQNALLLYQERINKFRATFNYSDFISFIKGLDRSFIDIICTIMLNYSYVPTDLRTLQNIDLQFMTGITTDSVISSRYYNENNFLVYLKDDGHQSINEYMLTDTAEIITKSNVGTVDYNTGEIKIGDITINALFNSEVLDISAAPVDYNITSKFQNLFNISATKATIDFIRSLEN